MNFDTRHYSIAQQCVKFRIILPELQQIIPAYWIELNLNLNFKYQINLNYGEKRILLQRVFWYSA